MPSYRTWDPRGHRDWLHCKLAASAKQLHLLPGQHPQAADPSRSALPISFPLVGIFKTPSTGESREDRHAIGGPSQCGTINAPACNAVAEQSCCECCEDGLSSHVPSNGRAFYAQPMTELTFAPFFLDTARPIFFPYYASIPEGGNSR